MLSILYLPQSHHSSILVIYHGPLLTTDFIQIIIVTHEATVVDSEDKI